MDTSKPGLMSGGTLTVRDAAKFAGVSRAQMFVWMKDDGLPFIKFGKGKKRLIPKQGLIEFLEERLTVAEVAAHG